MLPTYTQFHSWQRLQSLLSPDHYLETQTIQSTGLNLSVFADWWYHSLFMFVLPFGDDCSSHTQRRTHRHIYTYIIIYMYIYIMHICIYNIQRIYLIIFFYIFETRQLTFPIKRWVWGAGVETSQFFSVLRKRPWSARWERASPHCAATTGNCLENSWRRRWLDCLPRCSWWVLPATELLGLPWKKHWDFCSSIFSKLANGCKWSIWGGHMSCIFQLRGWYHHSYPFQ